MIKFVHFITQLILISLCSNLIDSKCFEKFNHFSYQRNGTVDVYAFQGGIDRFILSGRPDETADKSNSTLDKNANDHHSDQLIIYASSYLYLFKDQNKSKHSNFVLKHCLPPFEDLNLSANKILLEIIDKTGPKRYLVCNTSNSSSSKCSIVRLGDDVITKENEFTFNLNMNLSACSIDSSAKLVTNSSVDLLFVCSPSTTEVSSYISHIRFDLNSKRFQILDDGRSQIVLNKPKNYRMNVIYTFDSYQNASKDTQLDDYSFILKTEQINSPTPITKLGRLCSRNFKSYIEFPISCKESETKEVYTIAKTAYFDYTGNKKFLYITFNRYDPYRSMIDESKGTLLCAYEYNELNSFYRYAIEKCYNEESKASLMSYYSTGDIRSTENSMNKCRKASVEDDICPGKNVLTVRPLNFSDTNPFIEYRNSYEGHFLFKFSKELITSLASSSFEISNSKYNVLWVGTKQGKVYEFVGNSNQYSYRFELNDLPLFIKPNPSIEQQSSFFIVSNFLVKYSIDLLQLNFVQDQRSGEESSSMSWFTISFLMIIAFAVVLLVLRCWWNNRNSKLAESSVYYQTAGDPRSANTYNSDLPRYN